MLYFAYGSNLNKRHMARRCEDAVSLGKFYLDDARLVFRGVADCISEPGARCAGGVWKITAACERELDRYEGVRFGYYSKEYLPIAGIPGEDSMLLYVMNSTGIMPPSVAYLETIKEGYRNFGLPFAPLQEAVRRSWQDKHKTHHERARYYRWGFPELARAEQSFPTTGKTGKMGAGKRRSKKGK